MQLRWQAILTGLMLLLLTGTGCELLGGAKNAALARQFSSMEKSLDGAQDDPNRDAALDLIRRGHDEAKQGHFVQRDVTLYEEKVKEICEDGSINDSELQVLQEDFDAMWKP